MNEPSGKATDQHSVVSLDSMVASAARLSSDHCEPSTQLWTSHSQADPLPIDPAIQKRTSRRADRTRGRLTHLTSALVGTATAVAPPGVELIGCETDQHTFHRSKHLIQRQVSDDSFQLMVGVRRVWHVATGA